MAAQHGLATDPLTVVELGPGDSLGIGLMSLLTGAEQYYALDAVRQASTETNLVIFDELAKLLTARAPIPSGGEYAEILPELDDYTFPAQILSDTRLTQSLASDRLSRLRQALASDLITGPIRYIAPMGRMHEIPADSVDLILYQAVMEHVDQLEETYAECFRCQKPGGYMSHQIDLRCHDTASEWNGHWQYSNLTWRLMRGSRPWFINRQLCSTHIDLVKKMGFSLRAQITQLGDYGIPRKQLAKVFQKLSESDLLTAGVFILASKSA
jgi:SAM-dependent methyltransferase